VGHIVDKGEITSAYHILVGKRKKRPLKETYEKMQDNIKMSI
jgi:hypothetical protein